MERACRRRAMSGGRRAKYTHEHRLGEADTRWWNGRRWPITLAATGGSPIRKLGQLGPQVSPPTTLEMPKALGDGVDDVPQGGEEQDHRPAGEKDDRPHAGFLTAD